MRLSMKIIAALLLLVNGTGAFYGGTSLLLHPDGSGLQITTDWLRYSPFTDYFIPGLVLLVVNGLCSVATLTILLLGKRRSNVYVIAQGILLTGWIFVQVLLLQAVAALHVIMGLMGVALIVCGSIPKPKEIQAIRPVRYFVRRSHE